MNSTSPDLPAAPPPAPTSTPPVASARRTTPLRSSPPPEERYSSFLPLLLLILALLFWAGFQTFQLVNENGMLKDAVKAADPLMQNATKLPNSLDAIASETKKLADEGNPNAQLLVDELKKRGITIN